MGRRKLPPLGSVARTALDAPHDRPIYDHVLARIPTRPKRGDREKAIGEVAALHGKDRRYIERAITRQKNAEKLGRITAEIRKDEDRCLDFVRQWLSADEIEQLDMPTALQWARERKLAADRRQEISPKSRISRR